MEPYSPLQSETVTVQVPPAGVQLSQPGQVTTVVTNQPQSVTVMQVGREILSLLCVELLPVSPPYSGPYSPIQSETVRDCQ